MAQTKRKRRSKHRGNAVGMIEARGRTGRKLSDSERSSSAKPDARAKREARANQEPTWKGAVIRAAFGAVIFVLLFTIGFHRPIGPTLALGVVLLAFYTPVSYYMDSYMWRRRQRNKGTRR